MIPDSYCMLVAAEFGALPRGARRTRSAGRCPSGRSGLSGPAGAKSGETARKGGVLEKKGTVLAVDSRVQKKRAAREVSAARTGVQTRPDWHRQRHWHRQSAGANAEDCFTEAYCPGEMLGGAHQSQRYRAAAGCRARRVSANSPVVVGLGCAWNAIGTEAGGAAH